MTHKLRITRRHDAYNLRIGSDMHEEKEGCGFMDTSYFPIYFKVTVSPDFYLWILLHKVTKSNYFFLLTGVKDTSKLDITFRQVVLQRLDVI